MIGAGSFDPSIFSQTILRILFFEKGLRMPRKKQISKMNGFHHVMFRDVNGENIFSDDRDRVRFCLLLQEGRSNVLTFVRLLKAYTLSYKSKNRRTRPHSFRKFTELSISHFTFSRTLAGGTHFTGNFQEISVRLEIFLALDLFQSFKN